MAVNLEAELKELQKRFYASNREIERLEGVRDAAIPIADNGYAEESDITRLREALDKEQRGRDAEQEAIDD